MFDVEIHKALCRFFVKLIFMFFNPSYEKTSGLSIIDSSRILKISEFSVWMQVQK